MSRKVRVTLGAAVAGLLCVSAASATETTTYYTYDARGRLIKVVHVGGANNNNQACYKYDKADNRTNVTTTVNSLPPCP